MSASTDTLAGIILTGGQSSRMGEDKAGLVWKGQSFLDHARDRLAGAGCNLVRISGRAGDDAIPDTMKNAGPARAIFDVIEALRLEAGGYLFLPVDLPLLTAADLCRLTGATRPRAFKGHPLPCFIPAGSDLPETPSGRSVYRLLETMDVEWMDAGHDLAQRLFNVNTPDDLDRLRASS
ncbi:NTP transferase domain-containing protein [Hyphobacterium sp. HN65]|uniref:NTP transferase domain-containing protein n=1 Tax=Hyphobacterium lacteum TaxID=3116575 RepID=A0ABU7LP83_9PROT|nr:NTP transferase domain-containing protein [Hyphobacterium sp. HN65]MEE2525726.1 NTP transferase domain-containing protein [Hyphobacterium sp. HN65]